MDIYFSNQEELYNRLLPALRIKKKEIVKDAKITLEEKDIWEYLKKSKWSKSIGLSLSVMVDDIFKLNNINIIEYLNKGNQEIL